MNITTRVLCTLRLLPPAMDLLQTDLEYDLAEASGKWSYEISLSRERDCQTAVDRAQVTTLLRTTMTLVTLPATLWDFYVDYLWNYKPGSWVDSAASTFRVLAILSILPFVILTLLVRALSLTLLPVRPGTDRVF